MIPVSWNAQSARAARYSDSIACFWKRRSSKQEPGTFMAGVVLFLFFIFLSNPAFPASSDFAEYIDHIRHDTVSAVVSILLIVMLLTTKFGRIAGIAIAIYLLLEKQYVDFAVIIGMTCAAFVISAIIEYKRAAQINSGKKSKIKVKNKFRANARRH